MPVFRKVFLSFSMAVSMMLAACGTEEPASETVDASKMIISVSKAYVRAVPEGQENGAAFMILNNKGKKVRTLVSVESSVAKAIELHTSSQVDGVMKMRRMEQIEIPANGEAELKPGGQHIMLINLTQALIAGKSVEFTLQFDDKTSITLAVPIIEIGSAIP